MSLSLAPFARYYQLFTKNKEGLYHARFGVVVSWLLVNVYHNQMINQSCAGAKHHSDVNEVVHGKLVLPCIFSSRPRYTEIRSHSRLRCRNQLFVIRVIITL